MTQEEWRNRWLEMENESFPAEFLEVEDPKMSWWVFALLIGIAAGGVGGICWLLWGRG